MARVENTVFISYRRTDVYAALAVYENLKNDGYDVFFDYRSISSGDFEQIITSNIRARAHFLLILTPTTLDRCNEPGDWLRREIELAIDEKRNIVPLFFKGFHFDDPSVAEKLAGKLKNLSRYNGLNVHEDYFDEAIHRLCTQYLNIPLNTILHPVSTEVQKAVREEQVAVDQALKQIVDVKKLVNQPEAGSDPSKAGSASSAAPPPIQPRPILENKALEKKIKFSQPGLRFMSVIAAVLLLLGIFGGRQLWNVWFAPTPEPTETVQPTMTLTPKPSQTPTIPASETPSRIPPTVVTEEPNIGKDGMLLISIPAGEFEMGNNGGEQNERPIHPVYLDGFLIDQTEITNAMYKVCVDSGKCLPPKQDTSMTQNASNDSFYYGNPDFDSFPVIYVDWNRAKTYCESVGRRLPTEAEWEKAAGWDEKTQRMRKYPWGSQIDCSYANYYDNRTLCVGDTSPAGSYSKGASFYGVLNMAGNVWEWVADRYDPEYYGQSIYSNPKGPLSGAYAVTRGGSFLEGASNGLRATYRGWYKPDIASHNIGFRCAMSAIP